MAATMNEPPIRVGSAVEKSQAAEKVQAADESGSALASTSKRPSLLTILLHAFSAWNA